MVNIDNETFTDTIVEMESKTFTGCRFINCTLHYVLISPMLFSSSMAD